MIFVLKPLIATLAVIASCGLLTGCQAFGTGTGNPFAPNNGMSAAYSASIVAEEACMTVVRCTIGAKFDACQTAARSMTTFSEPLGLSATPVRSVAEIDELESRGSVAVNSSALQSCRTAIRSLDCASFEMQAAYRSGEEKPYRDLAGILKDSCLGTLSGF